MAIFILATKIGVWGKKLGKEPVSVELGELEMVSLLRALSHWNKPLYKKIKIGLIEEAKKEGFEFEMGDVDFLEIKCPKCGEKVKV
jgi:hypothetical protein